MTKVHPNSAVPGPLGPNFSAGGGAAALTVWRKSLLFNGNGFTVFDAKGNLVFRVDNYASDSKDEIVLMDAAGKPLLTIRRKKLSLAVQWAIYDGEVAGGANPRFVAKKHVALRHSGALVHVTPGTCAAERGCYEVEGSYSRRRCAVYDAARRRMAAVEQKESVGPDVFRLVVEPGFDAAVAMAIVILLDRMCGSRGSLLRSH